MTNYEKYKDFIKEHIKSNESFGIINGVPKNCQEISCPKCTFSDKCYASCYAGKNIFKFFTWLETEVKEPYILTEEELAFCFMVKIGYLWRSPKHNNLFYFKEKPIKNSSIGYIGTNFTLLNPLLFPSFDFVKNELISIEDVLNNYMVSEDNNG